MKDSEILEEVKKLREMYVNNEPVADTFKARMANAGREIDWRKAAMSWLG